MTSCIWRTVRNFHWQIATISIMDLDPMKHMKLFLCPAGNLNYWSIRYYFVVFPLISTAGTYIILKLLGEAFIRGQFVVFKMNIKHKTSFSINKIWKYLNIDNNFIVAFLYSCLMCILVKSLVEYINISNKDHTERCCTFWKGGNNMDNHRCTAYWKEALAWENRG